MSICLIITAFPSVSFCNMGHLGAADVVDGLIQAGAMRVLDIDGHDYFLAEFLASLV